MELPRFREALTQHKGQMDDATWWRYRGGRTPQLLLWLARRPDLAQALADDAREMAEAQKGGDATATATA